MKLLTTINLLYRNRQVLFDGPSKVCVGFVVVTVSSALTEVVHPPGPGSKQCYTEISVPG